MSITYDSHTIDLQGQADQNTSDITALVPADNGFSSIAFDATTITIAGGMRKSGESYFNTYDGVSVYGGDLTYTPTGMAINETYFLFVDMDTSTPATRADGAQVEQVVPANLHKNTLFNPDPAKYMRIGVFKTDGSGDITSATSLIPIVDGGASSIEAQTDTVITSIGTGELLKWSGSAWINNTLAEASISATGHSHTESDISDLQSYLLNITSEPLSDLSDATITSIGTGELLKWSGSAWINNTLAEANVSAVGHGHTESDISDLQSYLLNITAEPLSDLSDATITSIADGELLRWNGSAWINNTLAEAGITATGHSHTESDISDLQSYLLNIVEDTSPQLGGNLDSNNYHITLNNTGTSTELRFAEPSGGGTSYTGFKAGAMTGNTVYTLPLTGGTAGQVLSWNASDVLTWEDGGGGGASGDPRKLFVPSQHADFATAHTAAADGDIIVIEDGTYNITVTWAITKKINLEMGPNVIIDGTSGLAKGISVGAADVQVYANGALMRNFADASDYAVYFEPAGIRGKIVDARFTGNDGDVFVQASTIITDSIGY